MKKLFAIILCAAAVFLTACGTNSGEETTTTAQADTTAADFTAATQPAPFYTKKIEIDPDDPYSEYMKESCEEAAAALENVDPADFERRMQQMQYMYYCFYDLNGDGVDEMLLGDWKKIGKYADFSESTPKREIKLSGICTIRDSETKCFDFDDLYWSEFIYDRVVLSNGLIMNTWGPENNPSHLFAYFDGQELVTKSFIFHSMPDDTYYEVFENDEDQEITEEEYHRLIAENIGDATPVEIEWKRIDQYGQ